ncbi:hypothetical protein CKAH01_15855 [Colletotrichum kahawae]|uniref:Uncharacterized protein n=1 Tax=Colletotrichum kahawae TaxID=34407 RepID=A0AAD9YH89_COLKA|nr:hypothetical protein CKAH01_15855 [Colletotrichum kahawae]
MLYTSLVLNMSLCTLGRTGSF